jgi:hypothetical protein
MKYLLNIKMALCLVGLITTGAVRLYSLWPLMSPIKIGDSIVVKKILTYRVSDDRLYYFVCGYEVDPITQNPTGDSCFMTTPLLPF